MIIKRVDSHKPSFADGFYPGIIQRIEVKNEKSRFTEVEERVVLNIILKIETPLGPVNLASSVTASLNPKSKLTRLLEDMEMLPAVNEDFDTDSLIGLPVTVLVEKVMKNGFHYTNVNRIKKREYERIAV